MNDVPTITKMSPTEKLLDQIETDSALSARCTALFEREFAVENTVKQIVAALSATGAVRP